MVVSSVGFAYAKCVHCGQFSSEFFALLPIFPAALMLSFPWMYANGLYVFES